MCIVLVRTVIRDDRFFIFLIKRRLSLFRLNRRNCYRAGTGWCVKDGAAGSGDFAKQNTTPYPLHIRQFLLTEESQQLILPQAHGRRNSMCFFCTQIEERNSILKERTRIRSGNGKGRTDLLPCFPDQHLGTVPHQYRNQDPPPDDGAVRHPQCGNHLHRLLRVL